ncbi:hypothetical protein SAMN05421505_106205 [Sinosporangium album]|uniref:Secreted protein n=1 Tax=Sinosporangium album TaxID=504805 RepID=A0A1G7W5A1_9ACTN|nr:hypothetical protein [Sinosporangium album]SDG67165.1 hypothetical protein SAMN05421505_106205 [Sinosporangium album]
MIRNFLGKLALVTASVSVAFTGLAPAGAQANTPSTSSAQAGAAGYSYVQPRKAPCGGFDGYVEWGGSGTVADPAWVELQGQHWSVCDGYTAYIYLESSIGGDSYYVGLVDPEESIPLNWGTTKTGSIYDNLYVVVCVQPPVGRFVCGEPAYA